MEDVERSRRPVLRPYRLFWADAYSREESDDARAGWYYESREGLQGPFKTRQEAFDHLETLIRNSRRAPRKKWH